MANLQRLNWLGQECSHLERVFIYNHCYLRQVRVSILDIHLINSLWLDLPESCHDINLMSLASTGFHKPHAWSPWKLRSTAQFCSRFCFRKCIRLLSNSMISINLMHGLLAQLDFVSRFYFRPLSLVPTTNLNDDMAST